MSEDGKEREIFYVSLFPTKLKYYLEKAEYKGNKKTINVIFTKMEKVPEVFYAIVKQFSNESKKQGFGHEQMVQNAIKYRDFNRVTSITASAIGVNNDIEFMKRIGDGDVSFYGTIEGSPFKFPWNGMKKFYISFGRKLTEMFTLKIKNIMKAIRLR